MKQTRVAIYTRVSTDDQSTKTQEHELRQYAKHRRWTVQQVYTDHGFSGAAEKRPALDELLRDTRKRKFDVVLVWKFDRFARSLRQLVTALELFRKLNGGVPIETVAVLLGNSVKVVEKHYSPWIESRQKVLGEAVKATWG